MKFKLIKYVLLLLTGVTFACQGINAQYFNNPSFEGAPGINSTPADWEAFDSQSTPDTEPLECDIFRAYDGDTYLTLVTRGPRTTLPNTSESVRTRLIQSLEENISYDISLFLARRENVGFFTWEEGFVAYDSPVVLKIYGSTSPDQKESLLATSDIVSLNSWQEYNFSFLAEAPYSWIILQVDISGEVPGNGNVAIDKISILPDTLKIPGREEELFIPNVFTPDFNGINDYFEITGLRPYSSLLVFDSNGRLVYQNENYRNDWDGRDMDGQVLPENTYWYVLIEPGFSEKKKGYVYLKR
jgi:gliding motility-associated-like protein